MKNPKTQEEINEIIAELLSVKNLSDGEMKEIALLEKILTDKLEPKSK